MLREVYKFDSDLDIGDLMMAERVPSILTRYTTPEERAQLAQWLRKTFELDIDWYNDDVSDLWGNERFLLGLEADMLGDDTLQRVCEESGSYAFLIERLLTRGRVDEAIQEAHNAEAYNLLEIADIFIDYSYERLAEQLIEKRTANSSNSELLTWLKNRYEARGDTSNALDMAIRLFRAYPYLATIERFREIHNLAQSPGRWDTVRAELLAHLQETNNVALQIEIALDEGRVENALTLLKAQRPKGSIPNGPFGHGNFDVGIEVAKAAEKDYPKDAIGIYKLYVETRIEWRDRSNYQIACQYLLSIRNLYQKIGQEAEWKEYISQLREQYRRLPALKDEMSKAKL